MVIQAWSVCVPRRCWGSDVAPAVACKLLSPLRFRAGELSTATLEMCAVSECDQPSAWFFHLSARFDTAYKHGFDDYVDKWNVWQLV